MLLQSEDKRDVCTKTRLHKGLLPAKALGIFEDETSLINLHLETIFFHFLSAEFLKSMKSWWNIWIMELSQLFFTAHIMFTTTLIKLPHFFMVRQKNALITDRFEVRIYCARFNFVFKSHTWHWKCSHFHCAKQM